MRIRTSLRWLVVAGALALAVPGCRFFFERSTGPKHAQVRAPLESGRSLLEHRGKPALHVRGKIDRGVVRLSEFPENPPGGGSGDSLAITVYYQGNGDSLVIDAYCRGHGNFGAADGFEGWYLWGLLDTDPDEGLPYNDWEYELTTANSYPYPPYGHQPYHLEDPYNFGDPPYTEVRSIFYGQRRVVVKMPQNPLVPGCSGFDLYIWKITEDHERGDLELIDNSGFTSCE